MVNFVQMVKSMTTITIPTQVVMNAQQLQSLKAVEGVASIQLVAHQNIEIAFDCIDFNIISQFLDVFNEIEGSSNLVVSSFEINHLSCDGCANSAKRILGNQTGVYFSQVDFPTKTAVVWFDSSLISAVQLKAAVAQLGYELVIE